jgi:hypothetical protein
MWPRSRSSIGSRPVTTSEAHADAGKSLEPVRALLFGNLRDGDFQTLQSLRRGSIGLDAEAIRALFVQEQRDLPQLLRDLLILRDAHGV